jgi:hypothetical protein
MRRHSVVPWLARGRQGSGECRDAALRCGKAGAVSGDAVGSPNESASRGYPGQHKALPSGVPDRAQVPDLYGGRCRARTYDPLIKSPRKRDPQRTPGDFGHEKRG